MSVTRLGPSIEYVLIDPFEFSGSGAALDLEPGVARSVEPMPRVAQAFLEAGRPPLLGALLDLGRSEEELALGAGDVSIVTAWRSPMR